MRDQRENPTPWHLPWLKRLEFTKKHQHFHEPNQPLEGRAVAVLGGGPSLTDEVARQLSPRATICVNNAYQLVGRPTVIVAQDRRWYEWHRTHIVGKGHTIVCPIRPNAGPSMPPGSVYHMEKQRDLDMPHSRRALCGNNSGQGALCLAYLLGASRIYLAGFDLGFEGQNSHWHGGHPVPPSQANYVTRFRPRVENMVEELAKVGVATYAITDTYANLPRMDLATALKDLDETHRMDNPETPAPLSQ